MEIFKELNNLGYKHYLPMTVEELDALSIDSVEFSIEANLAFDWFREKHNYLCWINKDDETFTYNINFRYNINLGDTILGLQGFKTYEEAHL